MFPQKAKISVEIESQTYPLGQKIEQSADGASLALVALSHTPVERRLYAAMLAAMSSATNRGVNQSEPGADVFTVRKLMDLTGIVSLSTIRRGLEGLVAKFSIERELKSNGNGSFGSMLGRQWM